ncbi:prolyl oligopeptidase family serine peptidase [Cohnella thailandensis]|uniref:Prolyl oligopeptidase family serine peptidase n=1 Tax=Cohnella thailandensis TaxID=557557 RepID=A0A841T7N1_9BACL|nr:prolyl oligopeptidase family serine peptidase [Cohnella thailandensis]MBB6637181.1 prolyl oligopeptidase family serine peptidase [Cohnella thailandensis]MBP1976998.1 acetyl esterase/lipase [Cohnella thailandensis]
MKKALAVMLLLVLAVVPFGQIVNASESTPATASTTAVAGPITDLTYFSRSETDMTLRWTPAQGALMIYFEQRQVGSSVWVRSTTKDWLWPNAAYAIITGLTANTLYEFRMVVLGGPNAGVSNAVTLKTDMNLILKSITAGNFYDWNPGDGTIYSDLTYGPKASNKYDLYIPTNASQTDDIGVILNLHGGSWTSGDKADDAPHMKWYAHNDYIAASMNYTLVGGTDGGTVATIMDEIEACIEALKQELLNRGYNVTRLAITGYSAGGHLASLFGYSRAEDSALPIELVINSAGPADFNIDSWYPLMPDFVVAGYVSLLTGQTVTVDQMLNGEADELIRSISPAQQVSSDAPATVLAYGAYDQLVGQGNNQKLVAALQQAGVDFEYILYPYSDHVLGNDPDKVLERQNTVLSYLNTYLAPIPVAQT